MEKKEEMTEEEKEDQEKLEATPVCGFLPDNCTLIIRVPLNKVQMFYAVGFITCAIDMARGWYKKQAQEQRAVKTLAGKLGMNKFVNGLMGKK